MRRRIALAVSVAVVAAAAVVVPMPLAEIRPGAAHAVEDRISLGTATTEINGDLDLLTVRETTPNLLEAVIAAIDPARDLLPASERIPADMDPDAYREVQRQAFRTAFLTAVAVAAREAGIEVDLQTRAVVAQVLEGGPSDGVLLPGDVITGIGDVEVDSGTDLVEQLQSSDEERTVALTLRRSGTTRTVEVRLRRVPSTEQPVLGIVVETVADDPDLPFEAELDQGGISGSSAGLMLALTATDMLLEEDLAGGRTIAGTGTLDLDGTVGPVAGVAEKTRVAIAERPDLLLVPVEQLEEAAAAVDAGIRVVGVRTFAEALDAVRGTAQDVAAPG